MLRAAAVLVSPLLLGVAVVIPLPSAQAFLSRSPPLFASRRVASDRDSSNNSRCQPSENTIHSQPWSAVKKRRKKELPGSYLSGNDDIHMWSMNDEEEGSQGRRGSSRSVFDMDELRYRMARNEILGPGVDPRAPLPEEVHIILFYPDTDNEGVHTIEFPKGSGNNVILAFECETECDRFAHVLRDQQFFDPSPRDINLRSLEAYCETLGVQVQVVPSGTHLSPPSGIVDKLDHDPTLKETKSNLDKLFDLELFDDELMPEGEGVLLEEEFGSWE